MAIRLGPHRYHCQKHFSRPTLDDGTLSQNTGEGARVLNKRTAEVLAAAEASRATPLAYMLEVTPINAAMRWR
jgi:hypothetical protein